MPRTRENYKDSLFMKAKYKKVLRRSPHTNVAPYLGCKLDDLCIVGLCFEKFDETLEDRAKWDLDSGKCFESIRSGSRHFHSLGYCDNDINPNNIMFRGDGTPVISDVDSFQPTEHKLRTNMGTLGTSFDKNAKLSEEKNGFYSVD